MRYVFGLMHKRPFINFALTLIYLLPMSSREIYMQSNMPKVQVSVVKEVVDETIIYNYQVKNNSIDEVVIIDLGFDYESYRAELTVQPINYTLDGHITNRSGKLPDGWTGKVIYQEETSGYYIEWEIQHPLQKGVLPGQTMEGFSIVLPREDVKYIDGHFDVIFRTGVRFSGKISS
ncbi:MAG: hypothetical protein AB7H86_19650 [Blastocatellales bacterium]